MKNILISIFAIAVLAAILEQFLPWWAIAIAGFVLGYLIKQPSFAAFAAGFVAIFLLWTGYAFLLSHDNHNILASKVATLVQLNGNVKALLLLTGIVGGLVSGFAALTGNFAAKLANN